MLTTIAPTLVLVCISNITNYFNDFKIEISVNLTAMLVITTMFVSVINKLPLTSYIKMIEVWLMFTLMVPFCEVIILTYWNALKTEKSQQSNKIRVISPAQNKSAENDFGVEKIERKLKMIKILAVLYLPLFQISFIMIFWFIGLKHYNAD